jgi:hypothetical protein
MSLRHFLLVFDHRAGRLARPPKEYDDAAEAVAAYASTERAYEGQKDMEIVLIGSDSLETVKRTHGNYFAPSEAKSRYVRGL